MGTVTEIRRAKFTVGGVVHHRLFDYRGVIVEVDSILRSADEWYEAVAKSMPPKNKPWYHVLLREALHATYVAEQNLEPDESSDPINNPMVDSLFSGFEDGRYVRDERAN